MQVSAAVWKFAGGSLERQRALLRRVLLWSFGPVLLTTRRLQTGGNSSGVAGRQR